VPYSSNTSIYKESDSAVCIVTRLEAVRLKSHGSTLNRHLDLPSSLFSYYQKQRGRNVKLTTQLHLIPKFTALVPPAVMSC
jgi:hypothetical protein